MPISADPNRTVDYILESDRDKPNPPSFTCRFLTCRQRIEIEALWAKAEAAQSFAEAIPHRLEAIKIGVVDWRGFDKPFAVDALQDVLTISEITELSYAFTSAVYAREQDLKKSAQQSKPEQAASSAADGPKPA